MFTIQQAYESETIQETELILILYPFEYYSSLFSIWKKQIQM